MACLILFGVGYTAYMITSSENKVPVVESETKVEKSSKETTSENVFTLESVADDNNIAWLGTGVGKHHYGTAKIAKNTVRMEDDTIVGEITVDLTTIGVSDLEGKWAERLVGHLKSPDFFNVTENQYAVIRVAKSERMNDDLFKVVADVEFNGKRNPVEFTAEWDGSRYSGNITFNRLDWDLRYGSPSLFADLGDKAIGDNVHVAFNFSAPKSEI